MIEIINLSKKYGNKQVLSTISLKFEKNKVYGLVGANGSGKTSLFKCLSGLESFEGEIISDLKPLKNHLGLLLTEQFLFSKITGKEYIQLLCNARKIKLEDLESKNIFDLPLNQYASTYSTGMKKKLAILAILLQKNDYFIFDEPFNGVDIESNLIITEIILKLRSLNKIVILSSHIFSTLNETCDEIIIIENGSISKVVQKADFQKLELEMKKVLIGDKIEKLQLS